MIFLARDRNTQLLIIVVWCSAFAQNRTHRHILEGTTTKFIITEILIIFKEAPRHNVIRFICDVTPTISDIVEKHRNLFTICFMGRRNALNRISISIKLITLPLLLGANRGAICTLPRISFHYYSSLREQQWSNYICRTRGNLIFEWRPPLFGERTATLYHEFKWLYTSSSSCVFEGRDTENNLPLSLGELLTSGIG